MKRLLISLWILCMLTACGQSDVQILQTQIADATKTAILLSEKETKTPTPTNTPLPTATVTPTATPDLTILGNPETPFSARWRKPSYSEKDFDVIQQTIHGRVITIAWEKTANIPEQKRNEISNFYFESFIMWWDIYQGFPYDSYTVVLKQKGNNQGETGIGYEDTASDYAKTLDGGLKERISHEVFHAWIGNAVCDREEVKYDDGLWFREGITQYYGDRGAGTSAYKDWMRDHFRVYNDEILGTQYDISLFDMPAKGKELGESPGTNNRHYRLNVYWKGALVAYMMDEQLIKNGFTLDDFLKYLYETYSLKQKCFTTKNALQGLNEISGKDWTDFFNAYIYGTEKLPLNGKFEYFNH